MSNKLTVDIKDFQSLKKAYIELTPGITVITGATNNGKSAIIRAIDSALFNLGDDAMVRGGQRYYGIKIVNDTHSMLMARDNVGKNEKTAYQFDDGTVQKKVGRGQLEEVSRMFNIREVKMNNGTKMKINFWYQNDKPFLMDKTSGQLYEFLSLSSCDNYARVLKALGSDVRVINSDINTITTEINTYKSLINDKKDFLDKNDGFDTVYHDALDVDSKSKLYDESSSILSEIDDLYLLINKLSTRKSDLTSKLSNIDMDTVSSTYGIIESLHNTLNSLDTVISDIDSGSLSVSTLSTIVNTTKSDIDNGINFLSECSNMVHSIDSINNTISVASSVLSEIDSILNAKNTLSNRVTQIQDSVVGDTEEMLNTISSMDSNYAKLDIMESSLKDFINASDIFSRYKAKVEELKSKVLDSDKEFEQLKVEIGYCPYCGREFF